MMRVQFNEMISQLDSALLWVAQFLESHISITFHFLFYNNDHDLFLHLSVMSQGVF